MSFSFQLQARYIALTLLLLGGSRPATAQVPCQECWNESCKEFKGLVPRCAPSKPTKPSGKGSTPNVPPVAAPVAPCMELTECNARCSGGEATACVTLGSMFENAIGVAEDREKAVFWYRVACDAGSAQGCLRQKQVEAVLQKERADAEAAGREARLQREAAERADAEARARDEAERKRKDAERKAADQERIRRLCAVTPPFHSPLQRTLPVRVNDEVVDPAWCGTPGPPQYTVPLELEFDEELTIRVNRDCNALTCTLKRPDGTVQRLDDKALRSIQLEKGRSELNFSFGRPGPINIDVTRVSRCEPGRDELPMIKAGESLVLRDAQASCQLDGEGVHLLELERGGLAELERGRDDWEDFGQRSVELVVADAEGARGAKPPPPRFLRLHRITPRDTPDRLPPPESTRDGAATRYRVSQAQLMGGEDAFVNPYRVFVAVPAVGLQAVRRVEYRTPFVMSAAVHVQVAALAATDGSIASGGISAGVGLGWQLMSLLGLDFLALANLRANDFGVLFTASPLMLGVRFGATRSSTHAAGWARIAAGPVLRYGTASNYTSTQPLGFGARIDVRPITQVGLFVGAQIDAFELEPAAFLFNFGLAL